MEKFMVYLPKLRVWINLTRVVIVMQDHNGMHISYSPGSLPGDEATIRDEVDIVALEAALETVRIHPRP